MRKLSSRVLVLCAMALAAMVLVACGDDKKSGDGGTTTANAPKKLHVGYAAALKGDPTHDALATVTKALAEKRGWEYTYVNNNVDGPTAVTNAKLLANKNVDAVIEFQVDPTVMPKVSQTFEAAGIPWMSYSVPGPGAYLIGDSDVATGLTIGRALGKLAQEKWDCELDLLVILPDPTLPEVSERAVKAKDGFLEVCPDATDDQFATAPVKGEGTAAANAQAVARDALVAHPDAKKILFAGMHDQGVSSGLTAAKQLGRYDDAWAYGVGGEEAGLKGSDPHLLGSVMSFLEGWPAYAFQVLDAIAAGNPPPHGEQDTGESDTAIPTGACLMTVDQIKQIPQIEERVQALIDAPIGTTEADLYCPKDEG